MPSTVSPEPLPGVTQPKPGTYFCPLLLVLPPAGVELPELSPELWSELGAVWDGLLAVPLFVPLEAEVPELPLFVPAGAAGAFVSAAGLLWGVSGALEGAGVSVSLPTIPSYAVSIE